MRFLPGLISAYLLFGVLSPQRTSAQQANDYLRFSIKDLLLQQQQKHVKSITFLDENTLTGKLLHINKNESLNYRSDYDLVYYIINGKGKLKTGNRIIDLNKDTIVFVPRHSNHSFYEVETPLNIFELVSLENKSKGDTLSSGYTLKQIESARSPGENAWNPFIKRESMIFGLYMLPEKLNGDSALVHRWDEVNLVTKGSGKFQVGQRIMDVNPGDIIYVKKGNAHFFHSLKQDLDILIFFEKRSVQKD